MYNQVEPSPKQLSMWGETRAALVWHCPAFTHLLYSMMNKGKNEHIAIFTRDIPTAACDGSHVLFNPDHFFEHTLSERVFIVGHEVSHGMFGHCELMLKLRNDNVVRYPDGTELPYNEDCLQEAMDYVINDMLIVSKVGTYNPNWLHNTELGKHTDSVIDVYRRVYKATGGKGGSGGAKGQKPFDVHLDPGTTTGKDPVSAAKGRSEVEWQTAIAGALASAQAQGKLPDGMKRLMEEVLEPQVFWGDKVTSFFARKPGSGGYDWRKPDHRFITRNIITPARSGFGCGNLVAGIDTSGSITNPILSMIFAELYGILSDLRPRNLYLMFCDAAVHRVDEVADMMDLLDVRLRGAPGGGGTSFIPVFDEIENMGIEPDALIYLTDGMGSFPATAPSYPVLWGSIREASKYPFGEVVDIPVTGA